jgi:hypothetical protein
MMTDHRRLMMDAIEGRAAQFLPFAPRLEIWYRCNKIRGTLPAEYKNAELLDIVDDLDVGQNYMIPDYLQFGDAVNKYSRGLGHEFSTTATVHNLDFSGIEREMEEQGDIRVCRWHTPYGTLQAATLYNETMRRSGVTVPHMKERLIKSADDYKAAAWLFGHIQVVPCYEMYRQYAAEMGNRTILNAMATPRANGRHLMMMELMDYDAYVFNNADYPEETAELAGVLDTYLDRVVAVCAASPAQAITVGNHFDHILTGRPIFREHFVPSLRRYGEQLHAAGKFMACHTDSDNENLLDLYVECGMDIADSICTAPLTQQTYREIRDKTGGKITLFGLIPSVSVLPDSMSSRAFDAYLDALLTEIQSDGARKIILAIADTTPPDADLGRVRRIAKLAKQVKPR